MFYVNDEPEGKFLYTETIKLYCIVLYGFLKGKLLYTEKIKLYCIVLYSFLKSNIKEQLL